MRKCMSHDNMGTLLDSGKMTGAGSTSFSLALNVLA